MRIAVGADERSHLTDAVIHGLERRGVEVETHGALAEGQDTQWPSVAEAVGRRVASGACDQGVLMCWTGTGVSMAANKVPGVRAALCADAETARGARAYNDANVLCMSLRLTSEPIAEEILGAWFTAGIDEEERGNIERVKEMDRTAVR